jgi:outer membrane lipoprotein SlyB
MQRSRIWNSGMAAVGALALAGCATGPAPQATSASGLSAGKMHLSAQMSSSIFLQPVAPSQRVVFVEGHNTSSAQNLGFQALVEQDLVNRGYQVTNDPTRAEYMVMYNVRYIGDQTSDNTAAGVLAGGFGAAVTSAAFGGNGGTTAAYGLAGAVVGGVVGHFLSQKAYMMVVDIQLEQRQAGVYTASQTSAQQGIGGSTYTSTSGVRNWMIYRDRIVAQAHGLDLAFSYATPALTHEVAGEISGLF